MSVTIAIHQPNFFPWLGYFDKIVRADVFVFLDHVQFPLKGGTYMNRVMVRSGKGDDWLTAPVERGRPPHNAINQTVFKPGFPWRRKVASALRTYYGKAPHFDSVFPVLLDLLDHPANNVADFNIAIITSLVGRLGIDGARLVRSSDVAPEGQATDLLIGIVQRLGGDTYLCGGGADGYQNDELFAEAGITLAYQTFKHPTYPQFDRNTFRPGLSIIDCLMNVGFAETAGLSKEHL
ncbi:WbqC family protein [Rhodospira trueperi]|uniref:WbqC-like protein family protein n=1 Tax=Rhodospira trueperi TaxID=69960 RepID=A0A1G7GNW9_9PROT|nr:WbqC family protein [Rhodospira trueperi]SDE89830.1 WbqC-like protein family protein [Rhodospira trueperi]